MCMLLSIKIQNKEVSSFSHIHQCKSAVISLQAKELCCSKSSMGGESILMSLPCGVVSTPMKVNRNFTVTWLDARVPLLFSSVVSAELKPIVSRRAIVFAAGFFYLWTSLELFSQHFIGSGFLSYWGNFQKGISCPSGPSAREELYGNSECA